MSNYIDGFVLPIPKKHLSEYKKVAEKVAEIWIEYGAIAYCEFVGDDLHTAGLKSFIEVSGADVEKENIVFGWVLFPSKEVRNRANEQVPKDKRMVELVTPLINPNRLIFDANRMTYGGFTSLFQS